ncbi:MAG TPA: MFS transporter [Bryobacteraceae bacterium]|nr:MFS transporter [Bryobacteraceae bacterium]
MKYRHRVLVLLFFLSIITYMDRVCMGLAGKRMQADLGLSETQLGWVLGIFALSYALFEIPSGALGDRIGPRKVLTRIVIWWSAFTTLTGMVSSFPVMLLTRFAFGAGEAGAYPNSSSSVSRWFPTAERARALGVVWMASRLGGAIAPLLVVPIQRNYGWRVSFYVFGAIGVIWAIVWYGWYRDHPSEKAGVTEREMDEISGTPKRAHEPLPWGIALRSRNLWTIMVMYHFYCWGSYFYLSWLPNYLQKGRGITENEMQVYAVLPFVAGIFGNLLGGTLSDYLVKTKGVRFGRVVVGTAGLALSACFLLATAFTPNKYAAVTFLTLGYGSMDCMLPVSWALCLDVGKKYAGAVTGAMNMAGQIGSFLTAVAFGKMVDYFGNYNTPLIPMAVMLFISAALYTRINPAEQLIPESAPQPAVVI